MKLVPVDHDPFAPKLKPVEGDPFAAQPARPAPESLPADMSPTAQPQPDTSFMSGLAKGTQAVGKGIANVAGAPVDLMTMIANGLSSTANLTGRGVEAVAGLTGNDIDIPDVPIIQNPYGGGENIADMASQLFEAVGGHVYDEAEMTPQQQLLYKINDFGTQAATGGAGLIKAGAVKAAPLIEEGTSSLGKMLANATPNYMTNPYRQAAGRTLAGDVAGGVGSATAIEAADRNLPESVAQNPIARFIISMLGGGAGATALSTATRSPAATVRSVTDRLPAEQRFQDPNSTLPTSQRTVDQAVNYVHQNTTDAKSALGQLMDEMNFYNQAGGAMPTTGLMTDDTGLQLMDRKMRDKDPQKFIERDKAVRDSAFNDIENLRPEGANPEMPRQVSEAEIAARTGAADAAVRSARGNVESQDVSDLQLGDRYAQPPMNKEEASIALDKALIGDTGIPMRTQKTQNYKDIDPEGTEMVDTNDLVGLAKELERATRAFPPSTRERMAPEGLISDIKAYEPKIDPKTGENVGGPGKVSFKNLNEWRKPLSEMENEARRAGQFGIADSLSKIRRAIGTETDALAEAGSPAGERAAAANRFYKEDYKPFREGVVGERMKEVARNPQRDMTPASQTARKLIPPTGATEAGANVNEAISRGTPEAQKASREAIKNYFLADLKNTVRDGKVSETRLAAYISNNAATLDAYPDFKKEVTGLLNDVRGRGTRSSQLRSELETAEAGKVQTERDIAKSGFAIFAGREPEKAVARLFTSDDPVGAVKQLRGKFAGNKEADAGLRAAVADHLIEQVRTTGKAGVTGDASPLSLAKIETTFRRNEKLLREVYGEDVRYLNQARKRLEALTRRANQATPGSATVERGGLDKIGRGLLRPAEIIAKLAFGQLQGGGYTRSARLLVEQMPDSTAAARDLVARMMLDPELAKHVLSATPKTIAGPGWTKKLNRLMGWAEAGRASSRVDEDEESDQPDGK